MGNAAHNHVGRAIVDVEIEAGKRLKRRRRRRRHQRGQRRRWGEFVPRERRVRELLRAITGLHDDWRSVRPKWLMGFCKRPLELDCFSKRWLFPGYDGGTAVEVDGMQHSRFSRHYHKTMEEFQEQQRRDTLKDAECRRHMVKLVRVPHRDRLDDSQLAAFLVENITPS